MGKITVEVQINTFGTPLYSLSHPNDDVERVHIINFLLFLLTYILGKIISILSVKRE